MLGIAIGTVKSRINFVRSKLKDLYHHLSFTDRVK
ncbi:MAG: hypothetical protein IPL46_17430 [Saprospiraceae bacterium]|nr:hypothetical protein [Saprospiraceae bacterium]